MEVKLGDFASKIFLDLFFVLFFHKKKKLNLQFDSPSYLNNKMADLKLKKIYF